MSEFEAARRVIEFLRTLNGFRQLIEEINRAGHIAAFADGIADAIRAERN